MYSGYKDDKRLGELAVYLELLKSLDTFEQSLVHQGLAGDIFIILVTRLGLLCDVVNANGSLSYKNKERIKKAVNRQIELLLDSFDRQGDKGNEK